MKYKHLMFLPTALLIANLLMAIAGLELSARVNELRADVDELQVVAHEPVAATIVGEPAVDEWRMPLTAEELGLVERVVDAEAANQPYAGQMAVAQCILDRATRDDCSVADVVRSPYQFAAPSKREVTDSVKAAVYAVFHDGQRVSEEPLYFFYSTVGGFVSTTHENMTHVVTIDDHKFFN